MEQKQRLLQAALRRLGMPLELAPTIPLIELKGDGEVCVQNHRGILGFDTACICVATALGCVRICGGGLRVSLMNRERVVIYGRVRAVSLGEGTP